MIITLIDSNVYIINNYLTMIIILTVGFNNMGKLSQINSDYS